MSAAIRLSVPTAKQGEIIEIKALIRHDMESGYRRDERGEAIPRKILTDFVCQLGDEIIFRAKFHPGVSANPLVKFFLRAEASGPLHFEWTEQTGEVFAKTSELIVTDA